MGLLVCRSRAVGADLSMSCRSSSSAGVAAPCGAANADGGRRAGRAARCGCGSVFAIELLLSGCKRSVIDCALRAVMPADDPRVGSASIAKARKSGVLELPPPACSGPADDD